MSDAQRILDALASPVRREILWLIWDEELAAGDIARSFELAAPTISQHLTVLRDAGLVSVAVQGNYRMYRARRGALRGLQAMLFGEANRWAVADDIPEIRHTVTQRVSAVSASVVVPHAIEWVFDAFTDPERYSAWLGAPVSLVGGRFACTLEWGTRIRGSYEAVVRPSLIALRWDFADDNVPVPGGEMIGYIRFSEEAGGTRVDVHQLLNHADHAAFMEAAWGMVLGRLVEGLASPDQAPTRRPARPKRRTGDGSHDAAVTGQDG